MKLAALLPLLVTACKKEIPQAQCPPSTANVDGICRSTCTQETDCLFTETCLNQVCLPRSASEGPKIRLFQADRLVVTRNDPKVFLDYVVTNASTVDLAPMPGALSEHAGTIEVSLEESTDFVLVGRAQNGEDAKTLKIEVIEPPPDGELAVGLLVERFDPEPCDAVTVQWTVAGEFDESTLSVQIEADGSVVHTSDQASGRTSIYLEAPKTLIVYASADGAAGESVATIAQPAILCSATATAQQVMVGDSVLLEWETKGAAVVFVDEVGLRGRLYSHPVLDRAKKTIGRWLVLPDPGRTQYRIIAQRPDQGGVEELDLEIEALGERPPPIIESFDVSPEWFEGQVDLSIAWDTRLAPSNTLLINGAGQSLPGPSGQIVAPAFVTSELWLTAERNGLVTSSRRFVWHTIDELEPNDTIDSANPLLVPGQQGADQVVARYGTFAVVDPLADIDWYEIQSINGQIRARIFDPQGLDCAELVGARMTIESEGMLQSEAVILEGCPYVFFDGQRALHYRISLIPPPNTIAIALPYVLAVDVTPAQCGDGAVESLEVCDDGNQIEKDGCDLGCALEAGYGYAVESSPGVTAPPPPEAETLGLIPYRVGTDNPLDEGFAIVPASIHYFGHHYAGMMVHVNGYITLLPDLAAEEGAFGSPAPPNAVIAIFGSDLYIDGGAIQHWTELTQLGTSHVVQYTGMYGRDANGSTIGPLNFSVSIGENGDVAFSYDPGNFYPDDYLWIGGIEDASGRYAYPMKGCAGACFGSPIDQHVTFLPY